MINENVINVLNEIKNGNNLGEPITLVGAIKMVPAQEINIAIDSGLQFVAENKVQEFREKSSLLHSCHQHFIGHLQTNKVKYLVGKIEIIQSVDSLHLGQAISIEANKKGINQKIFAEINIGGELSKSGFTPENAIDNIKKLSLLQNVNVVGLMAMLPKNKNEKELALLCSQMRSIFDTVKNDYKLKYLSIGMSNDYKIAIKNGSNMIRLGSVLFGKRNYGGTNGII